MGHHACKWTPFRVAPVGEIEALALPEADSETSLVRRGSGLSIRHISLLTEVLTVINLTAIFHNTVHLFELST